MYRRPKFLEILIEIRQEMSREADYDVDLFAEMVRTGKFSERTFSGLNEKSEKTDKNGKSEIQNTENPETEF